MDKRLVIVGAGGHGKAIADIALKNEYKKIVFLDDEAVGNCMGFPIVGKSSDLGLFYDDKTEFIVAVGNNETRKKIAESHAVNWTTLIHPSAQIGENVSLGIGTVVMAGAVVNTDTVIGCHCIINSGAVVEHDNVLEDYVHISPGVVLGGTVYVGEGTHIGIGVTVINNLNICSNCKIGAGSVVVKNIMKSSTYVGIPAKMIGGGVKHDNVLPHISDWRRAA